MHFLLMVQDPRFLGPLFFPLRLCHQIKSASPNKWSLWGDTYLSVNCKSGPAILLFKLKSWAPCSNREILLGVTSVLVMSVPFPDEFLFRGASFLVFTRTRSFLVYVKCNFLLWVWQLLSPLVTVYKMVSFRQRPHGKMQRRALWIRGQTDHFSWLW